MVQRSLDQKGCEWLVVCDKIELSPVEILMELLYAKNDGKSFFLNLSIITLAGSEGT